MDKRRAIEELERGREMAIKLKTLLTPNYPSTADGSVSVDELLTHIFTSFSNTIFILSSKRSNGGVSDSDEASFPATDPPRKSDDSGDSSKCTPPVIKQRRGCYKRRKTTQSWTVETPNLLDDRYQWRKYGQKVILNAKHPRNYFRCTHKYDQNCQATKQVQRLNQEPTLYRTIYYGKHTCKSPFNPSQLIFGDPIDNIDSSSKLLRFNTTDINIISPTNMDHPTPFPGSSYQFPMENVPSLPRSLSSSPGLDQFPSSEAHNHHDHYFNGAINQVIISGINSEFHVDHMFGPVEFSDDDVLEFSF